MREVEKLEFELPDELYAREPREVQGQKRCDSKMLIGINGKNTYYNSHVMELADLLEEGDLVVLNNSKTISPIFRAFSLEFGMVEFHLSIQKDQYRWEAILTVRDDFKRNIVGKEFKAIHDGPIVKVLSIVDETKYEIDISYSSGQSVTGILQGYAMVSYALGTYIASKDNAQVKEKWFYRIFERILLGEWEEIIEQYWKLFKPISKSTAPNALMDMIVFCKKLLQE